MKFRLLIAILFILFCIVFIFKNESIVLFRWFSIILATITISALCYAQHKETREKTEQVKGLKMESVNEAKNEFLSFATHQLRSPLTSIKWGLNAIADTVKDNPTTIQLVEQLRTIADNMVNTVNDLLDISKIEQGGLVLTLEAVDLVELLDQLAEDYRMNASAKQLSLGFQTDLPVAIINGDKTKLRQVFANMIDNAIKYTQTGSVIITLVYDQNKNEFRTDVTDTGPGIPAKELPTLFEKFARGTAGKASITKGSGLGLYLGKKIIELHKGSITVASTGIGTGSTFSVRLQKNV